MDSKTLCNTARDAVDRGQADAGRRRFLGCLAMGAGAGVALSAGLGVSPLTRAATTSMAPRIVITAPTGNIGAQVLTHVLNSGAAVRVIARDPSRIPASLHGRIEIVQGSHGDAAVVDAAFRGADTVFWLCPPDPGAPSVTAAFVDFSRPACDAIVRHGVRRVVSISALGRHTPLATRAGYVTGSLAMDDLIAGTGADVRTLTLPSFMDNIARQATPIREQGAFFLPIDGDRNLPTVATRDIASVAAELLLDRDWRGRNDVAVLGPEDLSFNEMARIMTEVLGTPVRYQQIGFDAYKAGFVQRGMSDAMAQGMTDMARAKNEGLDNAVQRTTASSTPTRFRAWCEDALRPLVSG